MLLCNVICVDRVAVPRAWLCWNGWEIVMATGTGRHQRCYFK